ncbi:MAG: hypothetical protein AB7I42_07910 [Bradyrhizobium sp.]|jgi:hypothetical protein
MIELTGGPSAGDGNNGIRQGVGETASSLAELREVFAGVSDENFS